MEGRTKSPQRGPGKPQDEVANDPQLSDAAVADLAQEMCVPEELFRTVIEHYPELNCVFARRYRPTTCTA